LERSEFLAPFFTSGRDYFINKKKLLLSCSEIVYPNAFFQAACNKKCHTSAASFLNYSVSSFISVANPNIIKCIITIILSLIPAIYVFFFRIHTEPDLQQIDNINSSKLLFVGNLFIIGYIVFHELPVYI
jgi:hypothetical protein